jgi:hypothetical protein
MTTSRTYSSNASTSSIRPTDRLPKSSRNAKATQPRPSHTETTKHWFHLQIPWPRSSKRGPLADFVKCYRAYLKDEIAEAKMRECLWFGIGTARLENPLYCHPIARTRMRTRVTTRLSRDRRGPWTAVTRLDATTNVPPVDVRGFTGRFENRSLRIATTKCRGAAQFVWAPTVALCWPRVYFKIGFLPGEVTCRT